MTAAQPHASAAGPPGASLGVSAVVLASRRRPELELVLERLERLPVDEVLVVENGPRGEIEALACPYPKVRLLQPGDNVGIAGRNLAARAARGEFLLMLDDDSYPLPGAVETLAAALRAQPRLAAAGGLVRDVDEQGDVVVADEVGTFDWWLRAGRRGEAPPDGWPAFFFPEGASMLRREAYLEVGGFFEPYFYLNSELDLSTRLIARGWDVRYLPQAGFDHRKSRARPGVATAMEFRMRNHLWYLWLRFPAGIAVRRTLGYLAFDLLECVYRGAPGAWWRAVRDAWRLRGRVRGLREPLPREVLRRAELNRGRMHMRLVLERLRERLP